jgi:hypothetical protein
MQESRLLAGILYVVLKVSCLLRIQQKQSRPSGKIEVKIKPAVCLVDNHEGQIYDFCPVGQNIFGQWPGSLKIIQNER